jgi:hypothetical protein
MGRNRLGGTGTMTRRHNQPWVQLILYDYKLGQAPKNFYEESELDTDLWCFRVASIPGRVRFQIKFNADGITPPS